MTSIVLPIKYAHIRVMAVSYVTLCVPCHRTCARGGLRIIDIAEVITYRIYSLIKRTIFYEKRCLFDENLLKIRGVS